MNMHFIPQWIIQQSDDANSHNFQACSILKESLKCNNHKQEGIFCSGQMLMPFPKIYKCSRNSFMRGSRNVFVIDAETGIGFVSLWYWFIVIFWKKASAFCWKIHCGCIKCTFTMQWQQYKLPVSFCFFTIHLEAPSTWWYWDIFWKMASTIDCCKKISLICGNSN